MIPKKPFVTDAPCEEKILGGCSKSLKTLNFFSSENLWFSADFREKRSQLIRTNRLNIRSQI